jgi:hypothetical protein
VRPVQFFPDGRAPSGVHDQVRGQTVQIESTIEPVTEDGQMLRGALAPIQRPLDAGKPSNRFPEVLFSSPPFNIRSNIMASISGWSKSFPPCVQAALLILLLLLLVNPGFAQAAPSGPGWYLTDYAFRDGTLEKESVLAGTTSRMKDKISFKGGRGNIDISQNRYDVKTGSLLAGVTYRVIWSEPPEFLKPQEKGAFDFELKTLVSSGWKAPQQSAHFNQGSSGVYFVAPDGAKYLIKDIKSTLTSERAIEKGNQGAKRVLQMNFGNGFSVSYGYEWRDSGIEEGKPASGGKGPDGWVLTGYNFKDGSMEKESVLAGTSSRMKDKISFKGRRGNIEISQNRYDVKTGKLLAGVTYRVTWSDPPEFLRAQEQTSFDFEIRTLASSAWKAPQQSAHLNQGASGIYFVASDGARYLTKDIKSPLITEKPIERGTKGAKRVLQMNFGNGFAAIYSYEWR